NSRRTYKNPALALRIPRARARRAISFGGGAFTQCAIEEEKHLEKPSSISPPSWKKPFQTTAELFMPAASPTSKTGAAVNEASTFGTRNRIRFSSDGVAAQPSKRSSASSGPGAKEKATPSKST